MPRGRLLGGSSAINGMAFVRGQAQDFDTWAQMGNQGWSYESVLPFFKRMESYEGGDERFRGRDGPLRVTNPEPRDPLFAALIRAAGEVGIAHNPDYNGARQDGIAMSQATIASRRRMSTARCYLDPIRKRGNLRIETGALTESLLLEGKRCVGVRYSVGGTAREARAAREVVVSAGSINSPQLLELSGIGQPERLQKLGIEVRHVLPGVGENLRDHYAPRTRWAIGAKGIHLQRHGPRPRPRAPGAALCALRAGPAGRGGGADPRLRPLARRPRRAGPAAGLGADADRARPQGPEDRPPVRHDLLRPSDAAGEPRAHPHRLGRSAPAARDQLQLPVVSGRCGAHRARRPHRPRRHDRAGDGTAAGNGDRARPERTTDDEIVDWVEEAAETTYHPVGTCKMGSDAMAVVDARLRVHGIAALRVADASIMPTLTSGNTNAPSIMIGEKAADMVLKDAAAP